MDKKEIDALLDEAILIIRNMRLVLDNMVIDLEELIPPKCEYCGSFNMQEKSREIDSDESVYFMHCNDCNADESL